MYELWQYYSGTSIINIYKLHQVITAHLSLMFTNFIKYFEDFLYEIKGNFRLMFCRDPRRITVIFSINFNLPLPLKIYIQRDKLNPFENWIHMCPEMCHAVYIANTLVQCVIFVHSIFLCDLYFNYGRKWTKWTDEMPAISCKDSNFKICVKARYLDFQVI